MCKLRLGLHRGLIAQVFSLKMKVAEFRPSDLLFFFWICEGVVGFVCETGDFPFVLLLCCVSSWLKSCLWLLLYTIPKLKGFGYVCWKALAVSLYLHPISQQTLSNARKISGTFYFLQVGCKKNLLNICQSQCTIGFLGYSFFLNFLLDFLKFAELLSFQWYQ